MLTHIDKEIIIDAYKEYNKDTLNNSRDFLDFLRKGTDVVIYGETNIDSLNIFSDFSLQGRGESKKPKLFPKQFNVDKDRINKNNPYQLFFLNIADKNEQRRIKEQLELLVGFNNDYKGVFDNFKKESYFRVDHDIDTKNKFESWEQLLPKVPVTEVIICDRFLLGLNDEYPIEENYYKLINTIKNSYKIKRLLFFTSDISNKKLKEKGINIINRSKEILGRGVKFGLVFFSEDESEHDRHIFLNYHHIYLGTSPSFFFKNNGEINIRNKSNINVNSYYDPNNLKQPLAVLRFLKNVISKLKDDSKIPDFINSNLFIVKDSIS